MDGATSGGTLFLYGAVKNKSPLDPVKQVFGIGTKNPGGWGGTGQGDFPAGTGFADPSKDIGW